MKEVVDCLTIRYKTALPLHHANTSFARFAKVTVHQYHEVLTVPTLASRGLPHPFPTDAAEDSNPSVTLPLALAMQRS